jgi:DNA-binding response OmpR family regulator
MAFLLLADPSPVIGRLIRLAVTSDGHQVIRAARGVVAVEVVQQVKPDLVILESQLEDMDAQAFCRRLRATGYTNPVLVLTATNADALARELGADASLEKPFDVDDFLALVRKLVAGHKSP